MNPTIQRFNVISLLLLCFITVSAFAQNQENNKKDSIKIITSPHVIKKTTVVKITDTLIKKEKAPLYIIDGKESGNNNINTISPNDIAKIDVLKGESATQLYGKKGANGVVLITTKSLAKQDGKTIGDTAKSKTVKVTAKLGHDKNNKEEEMNIVIDGDHVMINGEEVNENDPRINGSGNKRVKIQRMITAPKKVEGFKLDKNQKNNEDKEEGDEDDFEGFMTDMPPANQAFLGVITESTEKGAKVKDVNEGSPAAKAGIQVDDIITQVKEEKITGPEDLYATIGKCKPDEQVNINLIRNDKKMIVAATLAKNKNQGPQVQFFNFGEPEMNNGRGNQRRPGFNFELPNMPELNGIMDRYVRKPKLGITIEDLEAGEGVKITSVTEGSPAEKAGLQKNDVITSLNDKKVKDVDGIKPIISGNNNVEGSTFKFNINRNGKATVIEVKFPKKLKTADL
ncbi:MAG: PDZ domain-containing protein [Chitinophagaceae bacterium]